MKTIHTICVIAGDGIGVDVVGEALRILAAAELNFSLITASAGYETFKKTGTSLPEETKQKAQKADAILFGAVTSPPNIPDYRSPIVTLRKELDLFANVRPFYPLPNIPVVKPLDIILVRENTEDLYGGKETETTEGVITERVITKKASERIIDFAFHLATQEQRKKVTIVHKANVLRKSDGLFLEIGKTIAQQYPDIECNDMLVDSTAMQLIKDPSLFDVIVTTNMFGDILSDEIAALSGGLGVASSANIGTSNALFEPVHGSAPKYAGKNVANPLACILSACFMLDFLDEKKIAQRIRFAVNQTLEQGIKTKDVGGTSTMTAFTDHVISLLKGTV